MTSVRGIHFKLSQQIDVNHREKSPKSSKKLFSETPIRLISFNERVQVSRDPISIAGNLFITCYF